MGDTDVTETVWAVYEQDGRDPPDVRALCMTRAGAEKQARRYDKEPHSGAMYVVPCRPAWDEREQILSISATGARAHPASRRVAGTRTSVS